MEKAKHTPGPWKVVRRIGPFDSIELSIETNEGRRIAKVWFENEKANACLIAESPKLLECLKEAILTAKSATMLPIVYTKWEDTIAKAEGKTD